MKAPEASGSEGSTVGGSCGPSGVGPKAPRVGTYREIAPPSSCVTPIPGLLLRKRLDPVQNLHG